VEIGLTADELVRMLASPTAVDDLAGEHGALLVVDGTAGGGAPLSLPPLLPAVVVLVRHGDPGPAAIAQPDDAGGADLACTADGLDAVRANALPNLQAATALAVLLRGGDGRSVADGLHAESAVYGVLQGGQGFARWRGSRPARSRPPAEGSPLSVARVDDRLLVVLDRPEVRNALDAGLRDALAAALGLALEDPTLQVELSGSGACFSAGGDLDELGTRAEPASAHLVRLSRNLGWLFHRLADRTHVHVHGPCRGSGVELPAFAGRVTADPGTTFGLPEVAMGLIPGSGGTVSLPRRIGRARTAWLAVSGATIDAPTALAWGLVDEIRPA
jgi:hypothetical protein